MGDVIKEVPLTAVRVEALVVMKIVKHGSQTFPTTATGSIVGMDSDGLLEISNTFQFPTVDVANTDSHSHSNNSNDASALAAAAPRQKANIVYQNEMIKHLKEVNVDANNVGWYTSAAMGNFVNLSFIENQYHYQKDNERTVALVHDLTFKDILAELPVEIHNTHLLTSFLHQLPGLPQQDSIERPNSLSDLREDPIKQQLHPSVENLDLSIDPFLEKTCDLLLESIESHYTDLNNFQFYQRQVGREQAKITQWQAKRKAENAARAAAKQEPLPEDEWQRLFKLPQEPSRLEGMLNAKQVEQYSKQVDGFTSNISAKMFAVRENLLPKRA
ncbi:eukaryotic translation initiation factor 3 subunit H [Colletotrichum higginsianum]|nr:eukaryotic translation initiation factor 3 subunit H [Colletotrichum higginsianum]